MHVFFLYAITYVLLAAAWIVHTFCDNGRIVWDRVDDVLELPRGSSRVDRCVRVLILVIVGSTAALAGWLASARESPFSRMRV